MQKGQTRAGIRNAWGAYKMMQSPGATLGEDDSEGLCLYKPLGESCDLPGVGLL